MANKSTNILIVLGQNNLTCTFIQTFMVKFHDQEENSSKVIKVFEKLVKSNST